MASSPQALIEEVLLGSAWHRDCLRAVRDLSLPDWAIGAGFVRNAVWDRLQGHKRATPLNDIDVLFFDSGNTEPAFERTLEHSLARSLPGRAGSRRHPARMHRRNGDRPYRNTEDALRFWLETPTAVAVRLQANDGLSVLAPFGLEDLMAMSVRPTAAGLAKMDQYRARMTAKNWPATWPRVTVEGLD